MSYSNITGYDALAYDDGRDGFKLDRIVIHHWGVDGQSFRGVLNYFCKNDNVQTSAHYVVEDGKVAHIVSDSDTAWHAGKWDWNCKSIGIECRPECTAGDMQTLAELIANLWTKYGKLSIYEHRDIVPTACPGRYDKNKIKTMAEAIYNGTPSKPSTGRTISSVYNADKSLTVKEAVKAGQAISNILLGTAIAEDGIYGTDTKRNSVKVLQWAMNKDYSAGLNIDGIYGQATSKALGYHNVRFDEVQYMVTALQVLLLLNGYNPHGVEIPGDFGGGCRKATKDFQADEAITVDGIAGRNTFLKLIGE